MDNMEKLTWRIWESEGIGRSLLIGGLLFYVPIINLLLIGYYGCWLRQLVTNKGMILPEWKDGRQIINELGHAIIPVAFWIILPSLIAWVFLWATMGMLNILHLKVFAYSVAWLPVSVVALFSPVAATASLIRYYQSNNLKDALAVMDVLNMVVPRMKAFLFPLLQYYGILIIGWPLLGFAGFLATLPLLAQLVLVFRNQHEGLNPDEI